MEFFKKFSDMLNESYNLSSKVGLILPSPKGGVKRIFAIMDRNSQKIVGKGKLMTIIDPKSLNFTATFKKYVLANFGDMYQFLGNCLIVSSIADAKALLIKIERPVENLTDGKINLGNDDIEIEEED
jgi:hypothetical protein